jgi:hypothetical protein
MVKRVNEKVLDLYDVAVIQLGKAVNVLGLCE